MKILKLGFLVFLLCGFLTSCSTVSSSDSSSNTPEQSNRPASSKAKPKNIGEAMKIQDGPVNALVQHLYSGGTDKDKFDSFTNCAHLPVCYKNQDDLLKPGRTQMANDVDHGGVYASVRKDGVEYYISFREIPGASALIITISNQNREPKLPDYQLTDCWGDGVLDGKRTVDMKNVADPLDFQMSRNQELYPICDKIKPGEVKVNSSWQLHYQGALDSILSKLE